MKEFIGYQQEEKATVGEFVSGHSQAVNNEEYPFLEEDTKIEDAFKVFAEHETVAVKTKTGNKLLNRQDVFKHLSAKRGDSA